MSHFIKQKCQTEEVNYNQIFFLIVAIFILFLSFLQSYNQHWTAVVDSDISNLYNSLRVINGEYQDHRELGLPNI